MSAALEKEQASSVTETKTTTALALVTQSIVEINAVETVIAELELQYKGVVFDVSTTEGLEAARKARQAIREPRYTLQRMQKGAKAPLNQLKKDIDEQAEGYIARISVLEEPVHLQITTEESRKEQERQERLTTEQRRVADLQERVAELRGNQILTPTSGAELIGQHIADLEAIVVDDSFQEYREQALDTKAKGLERLRALHASAVAFEAQQQELAEQEKRLAAERERIAEEERVAREAREAEAARQAEELRRQREEQERAAALERERLAEEQHRLDMQLIEQELADRRRREEREAEEKRLADQRAELERQQEALRLEREAIVAPTDPVEATDGELLPSAALFTSMSTELSPEPDCESVDAAILVTLDALADAYGLDDVRGKELIVRMAARIEELAA